MSPESEVALAGRLESELSEDEPKDYRFRCANCGSEDAVDCDPATSVFTCDDCATPYAFGVELPRVTHQPHPEDRRFLTVRYQHTTLDITLALEREYARGVALDLLSIADPAVFQAFQTIAAATLQAAAAGPRNSSSVPDEVVRLDDHLGEDRAGGDGAAAP